MMNTESGVLREISPYDLQMSNAFTAIGKEWFLICAGAGGVTNAMTASWGFMGNLWRRPAIVCFVRPQRFTFTLTEQTDRFSLCLFGGGMKRELGYFGSASGRDGDKAAATGTHYGMLDGVPCLEEAQTVLICRKMYTDDVHHEKFDDTAIRDECYPERDYHRVYVCQVEHCYTR